MKNSKAVRRLSSQCVLPALLCAACAGQPTMAGAQTLAELRAAHKAAYDPRVSALLKKMADAYAALTDLDQKTEFYLLQTPLTQGTAEEAKQGTGADGTLPRVPVEKPLGRTVRLLLAAPNLLRLETTESASEAESAKHAVSVCDGKIFWTYNPEKNWYTQEKAPKHLRDFQRVALTNTTLELMMLIGLNPFSDIENQFDGAKYEGRQDVLGMPVEVVGLRVVSDQQTQELHFYIGRDDLLLHRLVIESTPVARLLAPPKHDLLDDLVARPSVPTPPPSASDTPGVPSLQVAKGFEDPHPIAPPGTPMKMRITCDNILTVTPRFDERSFHFEPPQGASLYQSINGNNELSKLSNPTTIEELLRKANPTQKGKKSKPVRIKL